MDKRPQQGDTFPLTIDGYASDGSGVGRLEGMVGFVPGEGKSARCSSPTWAAALSGGG